MHKIKSNLDLKQGISGLWLQYQACKRTDRCIQFDEISKGCILGYNNETNPYAGGNHQTIGTGYKVYVTKYGCENVKMHSASSGNG